MEEVFKKLNLHQARAPSMISNNLEKKLKSKVSEQEQIDSASKV